jgi:hypothetical protein
LGGSTAVSDKPAFLIVWLNASFRACGVARLLGAKRCQENPKSRDDNRDSEDGGEDSIWRFLLNHNLRLITPRAPEKAI